MRQAWEATYADMVDYAKNRVAADMRDRVEEFLQTCLRYNNRTKQERMEFQRSMVRMSALLGLPDKKASLRVLKKAGYWYGREDAMWHRRTCPPSYKGE